MKTPEVAIIVDNNTGKPVEGLLREDLAPKDLIDVEGQWGPARIAAAQKLSRRGDLLPEHWHWNWAKKASFLMFLTYRCFGIEYEGKTQGLVMLETAKHRAKLAPDKGKPLVYVEFLEAAPWNTRNLTEKPRFRGVGIKLFEVAVRLSEQEGFHGRVGLLALPQAEGFYEERCKMQYVDHNDPEEGLAYYELTQASAKAFFKKEEAND